MSLSFPPLLSSNKWRGSTGKSYPGSDNTWHKALAPRPLRHLPSESTVRDMQMSTGARFNLLQQSVKLPEDLIKRSSAQPDYSAGYLTVSGGAPSSMPLYDSVWAGASKPKFDNWKYCKKHGHAPHPNTLPAPGINDLKSWFAEYGHPKADVSPGVRSEFTATLSCIPRAQGETSKSVRMIRGSVLR